MIKTIKHLYDHNIPTISILQTVDEALEILETTKSSAILTLDANSLPVGIITERDISKQAGHWDEILLQEVSTIMSSPLMTISEESDFRDAYMTMTENGFRHLVVVGKDDKLLGILSEGDFLKHLTPEQLLAVKEVKLVMSKEVTTVTKEYTVSQTIDLMNSQRISSIVIMEEEIPLGIFSERDSVHLARAGDHVLIKPIAEYMSNPVKTIHQNCSVLEAEKILNSEKIRRLIVVDDEGKLAGIITQHDLVKGISGIYVEMLRDTIRKQSDILYETYNQLEEQSVLSNVLNSFSDRLIIACDTNSIVEFSNAAIFNCLYTSPEKGEILNETLKCFNISIANLILQGESTTVTNLTPTVLDKEGEEHFFKTSYAPIFSENKTLQGFLFTAEDITKEQKAHKDLQKAKNKLEKSELRFRNIFEHARDGILIADTNSRKFYMGNKAISDMLGYSEDEIKMLNIADIHPKEALPMVIEEFEKQINKEIIISNDIPVLRKDGSLIYVEIASESIELEGKEYILGIFHDITQTKTNQKVLQEKNSLLKEQEQQLLEAQKIAKIGNWSLDINSMHTDWSDEMREITGIDEDTVVGPKLLSRITSPDDWPRLEASLMRTAEDGTSHLVEYKIKRPRDGEIRWIECRGVRMNDEKGVPLKVVGTFQDITDKKMAQVKISESETLFRAIFEQASLGVALIDTATGKFIKANHTYAKILGLSVNEMLKVDFMKLTHPDELQEDLDKMELLKRGKIDKFSMRKRYIRPDGNTVWVNLSVSPLHWNANVLESHIAIVEDITDLKLAEQKELKLLNLIDSSSNEIYVFDKDTFLFTYLNNGALKNIKYSLEELRKMHAYDISPDYDYESFTKAIEPLIEQKTPQLIFEAYHTRKDGTNYPVEVHLQLLNTNDNHEFLAVIIDITKRREIELQLREQEELMIVQSRQAAMGEMISMIAHQWRQPLSVVSMAANNILLDIELDSLNKGSAIEELNDINEQTQYMSHTIDDFRNFFQRSRTLEVDTVNNILTDVLKIISPTLYDNEINITLECATTITIETYKSELTQVIINILSNANDILKNKKEEKNIDILVQELDKNINVIIYNNGSKIPAHIVDTIFEPYFTTKEESGGTGLGLYMSKSIVEKHMHGAIKATNKELGVEFTISLPKSLKGKSNE